MAVWESKASMVGLTDLSEYKGLHLFVEERWPSYCLLSIFKKNYSWKLLCLI